MLQGTMTGGPATEGQLTLMSNLLQYGTSTTTTSTSTSSTNSILAATLQQEKLCHLFGWLGCNNTQTAWSFNNSVWLNLVKCTTTNMKHEFIKTHFCLPLQAQYGRNMDFTKHRGFSKMLETYSFRPTLDTEASKVIQGLSPLCFFNLQKGVLSSANYYDPLNR